MQEEGGHRLRCPLQVFAAICRTKNRKTPPARRLLLRPDIGGRRAAVVPVNPSSPVFAGVVPGADRTRHGLSVLKPSRGEHGNYLEEDHRADSCGETSRADNAGPSGGSHLDGCFAGRRRNSGFGLLSPGVAAGSGSLSDGRVAYPVYHAPWLAEQFEITATPVLLLYDSQGALAARFDPEETDGDLLEAVEQAVASASR